MDSDVPASDMELIEIFTNNTQNATMHNASTDYACWSVENNAIHQQFFLFTSLLFIVSGLVGNCLSIVVFSSAKMRSVSVHGCLVALAISDSVYLVAVFLAHSLSTLRCLYLPEWSVNIFHQSSTCCVLLQVTLDVFSDVSPCIIVVVTVERYLTSRRHNLSWLPANITCATVVVVCVLISAPYHMKYMGVHHNMCTISVQHELEFTIWYSMEAVMFRIIPVIVIAVLNVLIVLKLTSPPAGYCVPGCSSVRQHRVTVMLLLVSSSYILLYLPVLAIFVIWKFQRSGLIHINQDVIHAAQPYAETFYILSFAINFLLYAVSRKSFREQLKHLMCRCNRPRKASTVFRDVSTDATQL